MTRDILLEVGLEEIPAKYVRTSSEQLKDKVAAFLQEKRIAFASVTAYATPRRLAVFVQQVEEKQADQESIAKGPSKKIALDENGEWTKAALGFINGQGASVEDVVWKEIKGEEYLHVQKHEVGAPTLDILPQLKEVILSVTFPVSMTWGSHSLKYIRPIHWIVALFGDTVIPFDILGVQTNRVSRGHRFLGKEATIATPSEYVKALENEHVLVDQDARKQLIETQIQQLATQNNWKVSLDEELLEEVTSIVEYPTAFYGQFDEKYLVVPDEVLITTMKEHQRYFYVQDQSGKLLPYFIAVRNGNDQHLEQVVKGNEKVLVARLEDSLFFTHEDAKIKIEDAVKKLETVNFHVKIGSMAQKMKNVEKIVAILGEALEIDVADAVEASTLYKFDLVTNMVGEFPELQGIMGEKYALAQGRKATVAQAVREHYMPISSEGELPNSLSGAVLALADKLDTLLSFFQIGLIPSGSNDPYALRRTAIGIVRLLETQEWALDVDELFSLLLHDVYGVAYEEQQSLLEELHTFMVSRVQQRLQLENVRHDVIQSAIEIDVFSIPFVIENAKEIQSHTQDESFKETIEAITRVVNLFDKSFDISFELKEFDVTHAQTDSERALYQHIEQIEDVTYDTFVQLTPFITKFFEENMVFVDDTVIRDNRLCLIADCAQMILYYMDPTKIVKA